MMFSIIRAAMPWLLGGSSVTVQPRYVVLIGVTHSGWILRQIGSGKGSARAPSRFEGSLRPSGLCRNHHALSSAISLKDFARSGLRKTLATSSARGH